MIVIEGLQKSYDGVFVLRGVDLQVEKGKLTTIVGPSGAGKSTLLSVVGMLDTPDRGRVLIDSVDVHALAPRDKALFRNQHMGFVFQFHQLLPEFTALENVCMPGWIGRWTGGKAEQRAKELLDLLGMSHRMDHKPAQLSGGEAQRVAVARALLNSPKVVLADEPSGNLDTHLANELHHLFVTLSKELDQTFLVVTHNENLANMADVNIRMADGSITGQTVQPQNHN